MTMCGHMMGLTLLCKIIIATIAIPLFKNVYFAAMVSLLTMAAVLQISTRGGPNSHSIW